MTPQMELWIRVYAATVSNSYTGTNRDPSHCRKVADAAVKEFNRSWAPVGFGWRHKPKDA